MGHITLQQLVDHFSVARRLRKVTSLLRLDRHPAVVAVPAVMQRGGPAKLHPLIVQAFYNCAIDSMYRTLKGAAHYDQLQKG
jgi:hypothetical protein